MKTVIHVWTQNVKNYKSTESYARWGLGDIVKGSISLFQICEKLKFRYICDIQHHPVSLFLNKQEHEHEQFVSKNKNNIIFVAKDVEKFILNSKEDIILLMTNINFTNEPSKECKDFMKNVLSPNVVLQNILSEQKCKLPHDYIVMHYRVAGIKGDQTQTKRKKKNYNSLLKHLIKNKENDNDILITDSMILKEYVRKEGIDIVTYDTEVGHLGFDTDEKKIKDTLFEFFIMTGSSKIKYHPENGPSGFIKIINYIFDTQLEIMK